MFNHLKIGAILLMAGEGKRFGSELPKQFHPLGGKKLFKHALDTLQSTHLFDELVLVCHPDWLEEENVKVVSGGKTRQESSYFGLLSFSQKPDIVLIHDAVRPFVSEEIIRANIEEAAKWGAVDTCIPSADTLVYAPGQKIIRQIPNRADYLRGQTPQTFRMDWILEAHQKARADGFENATDDCSLVLRLGYPVHVTRGDERNIKITSEFDLLLAQHLLNPIQLS